jgi:hypothetical protein
MLAPAHLSALLPYMAVQLALKEFSSTPLNLQNEEIETEAKQLLNNNGPVCRLWSHVLNLVAGIARLEMQWQYLWAVHLVMPWPWPF